MEISSIGVLALGLLKIENLKVGLKEKLILGMTLMIKKNRPDHVPMTKKDYNPKGVDLTRLNLLGERQLKFLKHWVADMKCVLSQTVFCNLASHHGSDAQRLLADLDSNG